MTFQQLIVAPITVALVFFLAGCGAQSYSPPAIVVTFNQGFPPPTSIMVSDSCGVAANVTNDSKNQGVDWTVTCGSAQCGEFAGTGLSGMPITYTAPAAIPNGNTVIMTATSVTDPTKFVSSSPIPITQTPSVNCIHPGGGLEAMGVDAGLIDRAR